jgi:hypothetical protein
MAFINVEPTMTRLRIMASAILAGSLALYPASAQQRNQDITIINGSDTPIEYVYFAACGAGNWGKDRLGAHETIKPGGRRKFTARVTAGDCCFDLRAMFYTLATLQKLNVDVCQTPEWVVK